MNFRNQNHISQLKLVRRAFLLQKFLQVDKASEILREKLVALSVARFPSQITGNSS